MKGGREGEREGRKGRKERGKEGGRKGKGKKVQNSKQPATGFAQMPPGQGWRTESLRAPGKRGSWFFFQQNASFHTDATSVSLKWRPRRHVDAQKSQGIITAQLTSEPQENGHTQCSICPSPFIFEASSQAKMYKSQASA